MRCLIFLDRRLPLLLRRTVPFPPAVPPASVVVARTPIRAAAMHGQPATRLHGIVVDAATGTPVRATITVTGTGTGAGTSGRTVRTDAAGQFAVGALPAGAMTVRVTAFGYRAARATVQPSEGADSALRFALQVLPRVLEGVRTTAAATAERAGFEGAAGPAVTSLSARELLTIPAVGEPDALRAASLLPGIAARNDLWAGFNVRGGESDQTQVRLDGIPIFSPFHLGGLFSTFIPDAVGEVDARAGALPASYGGRLSGVLDVGSTEERRGGLHGTAQLSVVSAAATLGGSLAAGRGSWNLAVRRTYADAFSDLVGRKGAFPYHFQDAELHAAMLVPGGGTLAFTAYAGLDLLNPAAYAGSGSTDLLGGTDNTFRFGWGNQAAGLAFTQPLGTSAEFVQRVSYSGYRTRYEDATAGARLANQIAEVRVAGEVTRRVGQTSGAASDGGAAHTLRAGYELSGLATHYDEHISAVAADELNANIAIADTAFSQRSGAMALFAEDAWTPTAALSIRPGVRIERVPNADWHGVSPRLAVKLRATDDLAFTFATGRYAQWTHAVRNEDLPVRIVDVWLASDRQVPVSTGTELVAGTELWRGGGHDATLVRIEGYAKRFADLVEPAAALDPRLRPSELRRFGGTSRGVDVLVRRFGGGPTEGTTGIATGGRAGGWLSYSYAISRRELGDESYYPAHDRRHDLNLVGSYRLAARTTLGARIGVASGTPYTGYVGSYARWSYDPVLRRWRAPGSGATSARDEQIRTARNADRYPTYERLDLSAHRQFRLRGLDGDAFINVVNVFNNRNVLLYTFDTSETPPRVAGISQLPFLPTLGARFAF